MESAAVQIVAVITPLVIIPCLYTAMLVTICHHKLKCRRFFVTATAIVITGLMAYLPSALTSMFDIPMSYEFSQVATVTIYYSNSIINPLIYFCFHPKAKAAVIASSRGQEVPSRLYSTARNSAIVNQHTVKNEEFTEDEV